MRASVGSRQRAGSAGGERRSNPDHRRALGASGERRAVRLVEAPRLGVDDEADLGDKTFKRGPEVERESAWSCRLSESFLDEAAARQLCFARARCLLLGAVAYSQRSDEPASLGIASGGVPRPRRVATRPRDRAHPPQCRLGDPGPRCARRTGASPPRSPGVRLCRAGRLDVHHLSHRPHRGRQAHEPGRGPRADNAPSRCGAGCSSPAQAAATRHGAATSGVHRSP